MGVKNFVVLGPSPGGAGRGSIVPAVQGGVNQYNDISVLYPDDTAVDISGATITAHFWDTAVPGTYYNVSGTLAINANGTSFSWTPSTSDTARNGRFMLVFDINGQRSFPVDWVVYYDAKAAGALGDNTSSSGGSSGGGSSSEATFDRAALLARRNGHASSITGGANPVIVTNLSDSGAGSLRQALSSSGNYITFDPSLAGGVIRLTSTLNIPSNTTINGYGVPIWIENSVTRIEDATNVIVAYVGFRNADDSASEDCFNIRNTADFGSDQMYWIHHCSFESPTDACLGNIYTYSQDRYATIDWCYFAHVDQAHLTNSGAGAPQENGTYYMTWHHNYWFKCKQRTPAVRGTQGHLYNELHEKYGDNAAGGGGVFAYDNISDLIVENCIAIPYSLGDLDYLHTAVTSVMRNWCRNSSGNTSVIDISGSWLQTNEDGNAALETANGTTAQTIPYSYTPATANAALEQLIRLYAGHLNPNLSY